jgi:hypothetical protein
MQIRVVFSGTPLSLSPLIAIALSEMANAGRIFAMGVLNAADLPWPRARLAFIDLEGFGPKS